MTLEGYRHSGDREDVEFYTDLIRRGICFVAYELDENLILAPSRFLGYIDNNRYFHRANRSKHGSRTNRAITRVIGYAPSENELCEEEYLNLCQNLGLNPNQTGSFGRRRRYWLVRGSETAPG